MNMPLRLLLTLGTLLSLASGCSDFSTQATADSLTTITFDDRLPGAFEEIFNTCVTPLEITYGDASMDLLGSCATIYEGASLEAMTLWAGLVLNREITLDIPLKIYDERGSFADFPVPFQSCNVRWDTEVYFESVAFEEFSAEWVTRRGKPALRIGFDNPAFPESSSWYYNPAYASTIASVDCNFSWQETIVLDYLNDSGINGLADVGFSDLDMDLYVVFSHGNYAINASTEVELAVEGFELYGINWDLLPGSAGDEARASLDKVDNQFTGAFDDLLGEDFDETFAQVEEALEDTLPAGHAICSIAVTSGELVITTDDNAGPEPRCVASSEWFPDYTVDIIDGAQTGSFTSPGGTFNWNFYEVTAVVRNTGIRDASDPSTLRLTDGGGGQVEAQIDPLAAGGSETVTLSLTSLKTLYDIELHAFADADGDIAELDETNNEATATLGMDFFPFRPERLELGILIHSATPMVDPIFIDMVIVLEVMDALLLATDNCIICDPWAAGPGPLSIDSEVASYLSSPAFTALVTSRAKDQMSKSFFVQQVAEGLVTAMSVLQ